MRGARHRWAAGVLMGAALLLGMGRAAAAQQTPEGARPAEAELIDRYSPVIAIRVADGECDTDGELYGPVSVGAVLGNPDVQLVRPKDDDHPEEVLTTAPTSRDLAGLGRDFALRGGSSSPRPSCSRSAPSTSSRASRPS